MKKLLIVTFVFFVFVVISGVILQKTDAQADVEACQKEYNSSRSKCIADNTTCIAACDGNQACELDCDTTKRNACDEAAVDQQKRCLGVWPYDGSSDTELPTAEIESTPPNKPASDSISPPVNLPDDSETLRVNFPPNVEQKTEEQPSLREISSIFGSIAEIRHNLAVGDGHKNVNLDAISVMFSSEDSDIQLSVKFTPTKDITNGSIEADLVDELPEDVPPLSQDFRPIQYFNINQSDLFQDSQIGFEVSAGIEYFVNKQTSVGLDLSFLQFVEGDWKELTTTIEQSDPYHLWFTANPAHFSYFAIAEKLARRPMAWSWKIAVYLMIGLVIGAGYLAYRKKDILLKIIKKEPKRPL